MLVIVWLIKNIIALGDITDKGLEVRSWSVVLHGGAGDFIPQGQLAICGDIFSCHNWGKGFPWQLVHRGQRCCQTSDGAHQGPHDKEVSSPYFQWGQGSEAVVLKKVKPWDHFMLLISCIRRMLWVASNRKQTDTGLNMIISPHWKSRRRSGDSDTDPCHWGPQLPPFLHSIHSQFILRLIHACRQQLGQPAFVHI